MNAYQREYYARSGWYKRNPELAMDRDRLKKYGVTPEQYRAMMNAQDAKCAICGNEGQGRKLGVDHNHETGSTRSLLCNRCNAGLGLFVENPDIMRKAIQYLENWNTQKFAGEMQ